MSGLLEARIKRREIIVEDDNHEHPATDVLEFHEEILADITVDNETVVLQILFVERDFSTRALVGDLQFTHVTDQQHLQTLEI